MNNSYSQTWFGLFLEPLSAAQTEQEIEFLSRHLPQPPAAMLDIGCGQGRHANRLAARGYQVTGIDLNRAALEKARQRAQGQVTYQALDMRHLAGLPGSFEAILSLWQSFGYFDDATNLDILGQISRKLSPQGRFVLDIYHRGFFEQHQGARTFEKSGLTITETKLMIGNRLSVTLEYDHDQAPDKFEWQLFTPEEISQAAAKVGLSSLISCTNFDERQPASAASPRMQFVFEKVQ